MTLTLGVLFGVLTVLTSYVPEQYRPWNFAAYGAIGLFLGARAGLIPAFAIALGSKLAFDLYHYVGHGQQADYLPMGVVYVALAVYPLFGLLLRRTEHPVPVIGVAALAGVPFFLITNFHSWLSQSLPYPMTAAGLMDSYREALPFYRGTLASDLLFSGLLFAAHAVLSRNVFPAERVDAVAEAHPVEGESAA
jgi:hypothetical protein